MALATPTRCSPPSLGRQVPSPGNHHLRLPDAKLPSEWGFLKSKSLQAKQGHNIFCYKNILQFVSFERKNKSTKE